MVSNYVYIVIFDTISTEEWQDFSIEQILVEKYTSFAVALLDVQ